MDVRERLDALHRAEHGRILGALIRAFGDWEIAEDAAHDAFVAALEHWSADGIPDRPGAWLTAAARRRAVDLLRRRARRRAEPLDETVADHDDAGTIEPHEHALLADDRLRLLFTCCHPALALEAQVGLTLQLVAGLSLDAIARAFLVEPAAIRQRLVRAKRKIRDASIPFRVPPPDLLGERIDGVLAVTYLVFNEGYAASVGDAHVRRDLCDEAIRLAHLLAAALPDASEAHGLLALMLFHDARRATRTDADGLPVLLEAQDRARWDHAQIRDARAVLERAAALRRPGPYQLQAAIASVHAGAPRAADTDWPTIVRLYDTLLRMLPTPIVALNRGAAIAMAEGPAAGLAVIDALADEPALRDYQPLHGARADLLRRLGRADEARAAYARAIALTGNAAERRFLERRVASLSD